MNVKDNDDFEVVPRCSGVFYTYLLPSYSYVLRIQYNVTSTGQSEKSAINPSYYVYVIMTIKCFASANIFRLVSYNVYFFLLQCQSDAIYSKIHTILDN